MVQIIINIIFFLCLIFLIYINSRLYVYINSLEEKIKICIDKNDNMYYSLKELIQEDFLLKDGRLKKFIYQKEKNYIYNGKNLENNIEI